MKSRDKILFEDYVIVFLAYFLLAASIIAVNMFKVDLFKLLAYTILFIGTITIIYSIYALNRDKELLN